MRRPTPVAADLRRLARALVRYAAGEADGFPVAESASLALGGRTVVAVEDMAAALPDRSTWQVCPRGAASYAAGSCPIDVLGPLRSAQVNRTRLVLTTSYDGVVCAPARSGPLPAGRLVVIRPIRARRSCASDFALALVADGRGRLWHVDLTLSEP